MERSDAEGEAERVRAAGSADLPLGNAPAPPGSGGAEGSYSPVIRLLHRHGIPPTTAQTVATVGEALRLRARRRGIEFAVTFDLTSGKTVGGILIGGTAEVDMGPHLLLMQPAATYLALHTHSSSAAFSDLDLTVLLTNAPIRTLAVVGIDGTWYALTKDAGTATDAALVVTLLRATVVAVRELYRPLIAAGTIIKAEATPRVLHHAWQLVAPRAGLRYDRRREPGEDRDGTNP